MWRWGYGPLAHQPARADLGLPDSIFWCACYAPASAKFSVLMVHVWTCTCKCCNEDRVGWIYWAIPIPQYEYMGVQLCHVSWPVTVLHTWNHSFIFENARDHVLVNCERWDSGLTCTACKKLAWDCLWREGGKKKEKYVILTKISYGKQHPFLQNYPPGPPCSPAAGTVGEAGSWRLSGKWGAWGDTIP